MQILENVSLIVGLGNPGATYQQTRHNLGQTVVLQCAQDCGVSLKPHPKFKALYGSLMTERGKIHWLIPLSFMNLSGFSVRACADFFNVPIEHILVCHDELELAEATWRLKFGGGHAGHNGLRDIIRQLDSASFIRLRLGIGRPSSVSASIADFVLSVPDRQSKAALQQMCLNASQTLAETLK